MLFKEKDEKEFDKRYFQEFQKTVEEELSLKNFEELS